MFRRRSPLPALRRRRKKVGAPPGSVEFVGEERTEPVRFSVTNYSPEHLAEDTTRDLDTVLAYRDAPETTWITVNGVHEADAIQEIGEVFGLHPLVQEDIANTAQRPKMEVLQDRIYLVVKMLHHADNTPLRAEQVSLVVGPDFLLSFQETPGELFNPVRDRLRQGRGRIRAAGPDYLAYALLDLIVDHYFVVLEHLADTAEDLEDEVLDDPTRETQSKINTLRRDLVFARRMTWPLRELFSQLDRLESPLWQESTRPFVRDAYDHAVQVLDHIESLKDTAAGLMDLYMSALSNRMNEVMKVLTIIGTIFIPLTFVAGIYGMNFEYMPELQVWWAYPTALGAMALMAALLMVYFYQKDWL